jgi:hypothetical protein
MEPRFAFYEIVRVIGDPPRITEALRGKEGIVVGMSDSSAVVERDYGVHINEFGEMFGIPEHLLEPTGRFGSRKDIVSRDPRTRLFGERKMDTTDL